jgi:hypothetical protein
MGLAGVIWGPHVLGRPQAGTAMCLDDHGICRPRANSENLLGESWVEQAIVWAGHGLGFIPAG